MKNIIIAIFVGIVGVISIAGAANLEDRVEGFYPQAYIVTEVDYATDMVEITSTTGFVYTFYGTEDWIVGDLCSCIMFDNGTENITDDIIVTCRYSGTTSMMDAQLPD